MQIESLHSGGLREPRPDLENDVRARLIAELTDLLRRSGREIAAAPADAPTNSSTSPAAPRLAAEADARALLAAVHEAIVTHHVRYRHRRELDYAVGDAARTLCDAEFDAALVASLQAAVPTGGRSALQAAGLAMSAVTQSFVYVPTHEAALTLMLIDADGEVLWFGFAAGAVDVLSDSGLRRLVRAAGRRLLHEEK
ncbi:hypothetical protein RAS1_22760 [Phycisphaerae bacterium RAS1]|nr:hypothetical protein RAS1_22760 [Phycisphaerae bacterium RAS1]